MAPLTFGMLASAVERADTEELEHLVKGAKHGLPVHPCSKRCDDCPVCWADRDVTILEWVVQQAAEQNTERNYADAVECLLRYSPFATQILGDTLLRAALNGWPRITSQLLKGGA